MNEIPIDYSLIKLQENIPLTDIEIETFEAEDKKNKAEIAGIVLIPVVILIFLLSFIMENYKDKFLFVILTGLVLFGILFGIINLIINYNTKRWQKDKKLGKHILESIVIDKQNIEDNATTITFSGVKKGSKIKLHIDRDDYDKYPIGAKVIVTYLKYRKEILNITLI